MARSWIRLYTRLPSDPKVQSLPDHLFRFLLNLWCTCGGTETATIPSVKDLAWVMRIDQERCIAYLNFLEEEGFIDRDGDILTPHNWDIYQYESDSSTERVRLFRDRSKGKKKRSNETLPKRSSVTNMKRSPSGLLSVSESASESESEKRKNKENQEEKRFSEFWSNYWKKSGKAAARKAYRKITDAGHTRILAALASQRAEYLSREPKYRPHAATWLNGECWEDEPDPAAIAGRLAKQPFQEPNMGYFEAEGKVTQ